MAQPYDDRFENGREPREPRGVDGAFRHARSKAPTCREAGRAVPGATSPRGAAFARNTSAQGSGR